MDKNITNNINECNSKKECYSSLKLIDESIRLLQLTPSKLGYVISEESRPCNILINPPYGDLIMPGFPIRPSNDVASAKFVEDSFTLSESRIICKIQGVGVNKGYWKIKILHVFEFKLEFYNVFGKKLKISYLDSHDEKKDYEVKDYIRASTKFVQTVVLSDENYCDASVYFDKTNLDRFKDQCYPFIKVNCDAIPSDIKVEPLIEENCEFGCNEHHDPYRQHEVEINVSIILFSNVKILGLENN